MSLVSKKGAKRVKDSFLGQGVEDDKLAKEFYNQVNDYHNMDKVWDDPKLEQVLLRQKEWEVASITKKPSYDTKMVRFNPSGASKCERELFFKLTGVDPDLSELFPYHKRWLRNAEAVHQAMQRDLLYMGKKLDCPLFKVAQVRDVLGEVEEEKATLPAWEQNLLTAKEFTHNGETFLINGMMDGVLKYTPEDKLVGFEFKTKSTTIATVGTFKMKGVQDSHRSQCICYSCLFFGDPYEDRTDNFVVMYESLAKDGWTKGAEAREDFRTFQVNVTKEDRMVLLDKFATVTKMVRENELPKADTEKCFFCPYKEHCQGVHVWL